ncbi:hypothetical protein PV341_07800 [Streptomyces sp. PA03-1a]|nr:hypothetical protein [Streptomyces sp. PA03-1a]
MDATKARAVVDRTVYQGEGVLAFGPVTDVKPSAIEFADSSPNFWMAPTQHRLILVSEASGMAFSHLWPEIKVIEIRRKMFAGSYLHFDPAGLGADFGLAIYKLDKDMAKALPALLANKAQAPTLPVESTTYSAVTAKNEPKWVPILGEDRVDFVCDACGGSCGGVMKGETSVQSKCMSCLRTVIKPDV